MPTALVPTSLPRDRALHRRWLLEITQLPTAAGREWRVIDWIRRYAEERPDVVLTADAAGNLVLAPAERFGSADDSTRGERPLLITAHLDHPAFVVERVIAAGESGEGGVLELAFRGGVMDVYFESAEVVVHTGGRDGVPPGEVVARLTGAASSAEGGTTAVGTSNGMVAAVAAALTGGGFKTYLAEADGPCDAVRPGDVAIWRLPAAAVDERGIVHTAACDDLAAVAAALSAFETLRLAAAADRGLAAVFEDVRLLFTRAEEIGFVGAIAACKLGTLPRGSRVIALENSRASGEAPVGGGPIVRVGDRMSVFSPRLTAACAKRAEEATGRPAAPTATQKNSVVGVGGVGGWQRKLMAGGACEATVFCAYGHEATCLCLPLGNYHNMADLDAVQAGIYDAAGQGPPSLAREFIAASDYEGLVDLLVACGMGLPDSDAMLPRIESLHARYGFVLGER